MAKPDKHIMQFFAYDHLPQELKLVSSDFGTLADRIMAILPQNPERTVALRKLLEAKDAAVRAKLSADPNAIQDDEPMTDEERIEALIRQRDDLRKKEDEWYDG